MAQNLYPEDDGDERGRLLENMMDVNDHFEGMLFPFSTSCFKEPSTKSQNCLCASETNPETRAKPAL